MTIRDYPAKVGEVLVLTDFGDELAFTRVGAPETAVPIILGLDLVLDKLELIINGWPCIPQIRASVIELGPGGARLHSGRHEFNLNSCNVGMTAEVLGYDSREMLVYRALWQSTFKKRVVPT